MIRSARPIIAEVPYTNLFSTFVMAWSSGSVIHTSIAMDRSGLGRPPIILIQAIHRTMRVPCLTSQGDCFAGIAQEVSVDEVLHA